MQAQVVLIIDARKEIALKYKKILQQDSYVYPVISDTISDAAEKIEQYEPDIIIVSDSLNSEISDTCIEIRNTINSYRPVLIVMSKSSYLEDKLNAFKAGADDYFSEPIDLTEFSARVFAHMRRHIEELSNPVTKLPSANMTYKVLKRSINSNIKWALMYLDIDNFSSYSEIYGYLAADKLLKTYAAIIKSAIDPGDFIGHIRDDKFIILTTPNKSDQIAMFLNNAFDAVSPKFYSNDDSDRGYLIVDSDDKAGARVPLVSTSIGIVSNEYRSFVSYQEAINFVINTYKLAKFQPGSSWVSDRPKIHSDSVLEPEKLKKKILIAENDAALAYLLSTTLEMQGYIVEATSNLDEVLSMAENSLPDLILMDTGDNDSDKVFDICALIKTDKNLSRTKVFISTVRHEKEKVLQSGADLYLPKPYELMMLFGWINKFFNFELY